jgi:hypothetical protein
MTEIILIGFLKKRTWTHSPYSIHLIINPKRKETVDGPLAGTSVLILQADIRSNVQFDETVDHYGIDPSSLNLPFNVCLVQVQNFFTRKLFFFCGSLVLVS